MKKILMLGILLWPAFAVAQHTVPNPKSDRARTFVEAVRSHWFEQLMPCATEEQWVYANTAYCVKEKMSLMASSHGNAVGWCETFAANNEIGLDAYWHHWHNGLSTQYLHEKCDRSPKTAPNRP